MRTAKTAAIAAARKSRHYKFLVGAALVGKGKVLDAKSNLQGDPRSVSVCAELRLMRDPPRAGRGGGEVYVARVTRTGKVTMARPCAVCAMAMMRRSVKRVHYTDWDGNWRTEMVADLVEGAYGWIIRSPNVWRVRKKKLISYAPGAPVGQ